MCFMSCFCFLITWQMEIKLSSFQKQEQLLIRSTLECHVFHPHITIPKNVKANLPQKTRKKEKAPTVPKAC